MSFPTESIEFPEQFPEQAHDQQGLAEGLSELSRFRIRRAFRPLTSVTAPNGGGAVLHQVDPFLDRFMLGFSGTGAGDNVTFKLPFAANADACVYSFTRADANGVANPTNVIVSVQTGDTATIEGVLVQFLSVQWQTMGLQSDGLNWYVV